MFVERRFYRGIGIDSGYRKVSYNYLKMIRKALNLNDESGKKNENYSNNNNKQR